MRKLFTAHSLLFKHYPILNQGKQIGGGEDTRNFRFFDKNIVLSYDKLSEIDLNKSEIFIDEDKTNYVVNVNTLLQNVFDDSLEKVLSICKNILNVEYSKRLFIRQINILTIVHENN